VTRYGEARGRAIHSLINFAQRIARATGNAFSNLDNSAMANTLVPPELLDPVVAWFRPRRVILFGSVARGEAGPDSDIDLLVILDDDAPPEQVTVKAGREARRSYREPADVIPIREHTFQARSHIPGTLSQAAALEGIVVYERA
jgi:uncharacterized protein